MIPLKYRVLIITLLTGILSLPALPASAVTSEEKGLFIATEADKRESGFSDFSADMTMILKNRHGQTSTRMIRVRTLESLDDGDKSLTLFDSPGDVKGTAFLNYTHKTGDDDQWLYLPALKRVKRISSRNKSGSFMGSEFAYEDISSQEVEKYSYRWIKDEIHDSQDCHVVERYPVDRKNSGYTRQKSWIDKTEYRELKTEFYDRKNAHLKTLLFFDYAIHNKKFWRPGKMVMENLLTGKSTELLWENYEFGTGLTEGDFSQNSLKRAR